MRLLVLLFGSFLCSGLSLAEERPNLLGVYRGMVGDRPVIMELALGLPNLQGNYRYSHRGESLKLAGVVGQDGECLLVESVETKGKVSLTGLFRLTMDSWGDPQVCKGSWESPDQKKVLPVTLSRTLSIARTAWNSEHPESGLIEEEPIFWDAFRALSHRKQQESIGIPSEESGGLTPAPIAGNRRVWSCVWHEPNVSLSLHVDGAENLISLFEKDLGRPDYYREGYNFRLVNGALEDLNFVSFFRPDVDWENRLHAICSEIEPAISDCEFTFGPIGLTIFHRRSAIYSEETTVSWECLSDLLRPGWPGVLGIPEVKAP